jgi:GNAT superfamily N-acetyltransferase
MIVAPARPDDLQTLITFRDEASRWLAARGINQWSAPWPSEDLMAEGMLRNIQAGETFIVWDGSSAAATITLDRSPRPGLWTAVELAESALYAHKLTVARVYAGDGLGAEVLDWAGAKGASTGVKWLRLDVWTTNQRLQQYYLDQGFSYVRTVTLPGDPSGALFQRPTRYVPTPRLHEAQWAPSA